jgi:hypothetical protein
MRPHGRSGILASLFAFLLLFSIVPTPAQTPDHKGIGVIQAQGSVILNSAPATAGVTIYPGDSVRTGWDGSALVSLADRGSLVIAANSDITFLPASLGSHFVALRRGNFALRLPREAPEITAEFGKLVLRPVIGLEVEFDVEIAADGSALVRCINGAVGIMEAQGADSVFLNSGESAEISASGVAGRIRPSVALSPNSNISSAPSPSGTPPGGKSHVDWIIVGVGGAGVAALVAVLVSEHRNTSPISPSVP